MIADESKPGFWCTGNYSPAITNPSPDMVILGKALSAGFTVSAVIGDQDTIACCVPVSTDPRLAAAPWCCDCPRIFESHR
jgi:acetylornithine/succinyldiaminopimelate/putrescine aminotransferase